MCVLLCLDSTKITPRGANKYKQIEMHNYKMGFEPTQTDTLTCTGVHCAAIADDQAISAARLPQIEVGVFDLEHCAQ